MKLHGLPESFWIVISPTSNSQLCDICFDCDFERFASQIRGGLDEQKIAGIFSDQTEAVELAERLLQAIHQPPEQTDMRFHESPWADWYATQESITAVVICNKETAEKVVVEPPQEWGRKWAWNILEDGSGIVMHRTH
jgi:hypothetical protein